MKEEEGPSIESIEEDDNIRYEKYVSKAPLHLAWQSAMNCPKKELDKIKEQNIQVKRGRFKPKEDKRILKNWEKFIKHFPMHADPFDTFGICNRPRSNLEKHAIKYKLFYASKKEGFYRPCRNQRVRSLKRVRFLLRLSRKLDDRLICDIYRRAKRLIPYEAYLINKKEDLPEAYESVIIEELYVEKKKTGEVGAIYDINPNVISAMSQAPIKVKPHRWSQSDDLMLESAIERQFNNQDPQTVPLYMIDFEMVCKEMQSCGYHLAPQQAYKRWKYKYPHMAGLKYKYLELNEQSSSHTNEDLNVKEERKEEPKEEAVELDRKKVKVIDVNEEGTDLDEADEVWEDTRESVVD